MEQTPNPKNIFQTAAQEAEAKQTVATILDQIPDLLKVKQVRRSDGSLAPFAPEQVGEALERGLREVKLDDDRVLLARMTYQVLTKLDREFDGHTVPSTADIDRLITVVLIDNNLAQAAKGFLAERDKTPKPEPTYDGTGLRFHRHYTKPGVHPYEEIEWETRDAVIADAKGQPVFEQRDVEVPKSWSQGATNIVVSKYFRGELGKDERETSVKQMVDRVAQTIAQWGREGNYFATQEDAQVFEDELTAVLVNQRAAFNSPVWFNVGIVERPQCSACFINSVRDDLRSILNLSVTEGMLFKYGSGTGSNLSTLRSSKEKLSNSSGKSSGPISFMKGYDAFAGVIKSGGKTRRAAKMVILNADHPDIAEFIECKLLEEKKAKELVKAGYDPSMDGEAYSSIFFQNANNSVRATDEFMRAVVEDAEWKTRAITTGETVEVLRAKSIMRKIAEATWECGDPGMQYDTTVNQWNPVANSGRINGSNPCVTGDTLVATKDGWRRIDSLLSAPTAVTGSDGELHRIEPAFPTGTKRVYRLTTKAGFELKLTADHKVLTANRGDVPASELTDKDVLLLGRAEFGSVELDTHLAEYLGLMVGDGCLTGQQEQATLTLAPAERAVANRVHANLAAWRVVNATDGRAARATAVREPQATLRINTSARPVIEQLKKYAVLDAGSVNKAFTPEAFDLNRESLAAVLRGLFTADGTVADYGNKSQYVSLDSSSLELLKQTQLMLLQFGIKAKLYRNRRDSQTTASLPDGKGGYKDYPVSPSHSLRISGSSRVAFEKEIGFVEGSKKKEALKSVNERLGTYADKMEDALYKIEDLGEQPVFDLTEPVTHHFVAAGLVVHNCGEYMFVDDSSCNLASLNLMKFRQADGAFDYDGFKHAVEVMITAQEIIVDNASYPTPAIEQNSFDFRALGLGYANLGALLMSRGLAYDSDEGRNLAAAITSLMSGHAYYQSAKIAEAVGPFVFYKLNEKPFLRVIGKHRDHAYAVPTAGVPAELLAQSRLAWDNALEFGMANGFRNAQISLLAPTGTIGFLMDCDTTGVEPELALVKFKWLVGGGLMKIVNRTVPQALARLGYSESEIEEIVTYLDKNETIEGAPHLKDEHLPIFDCAFKPANGRRSIRPMGHIRMMSAIQPFLSGAISKTVNMPNEATVEDIEETYIEAWKLGLKAVAIYRDGSKGQQVLQTKVDRDEAEDEAAAAAVSEEAAEAVAEAAVNEVQEAAKEIVEKPVVETRVEYRPLRRRLSDERRSVTHKFSVAGHSGFITVGLYDDGSPGEIFLRMSKGGSVISGLMDAFAISTSIALQYGVPLRVLVNKFAHVRFEPSGFTNNENIRIAKSLVDYIFRWLAMRFLTPAEQLACGVNLSDNHTLGDKGKSDVDSSADEEYDKSRDDKDRHFEEFNGSGSGAGASGAGEGGAADAELAEVSSKQVSLSDALAARSEEREKGSDALTMGFDVQADAPPCDTCGALMVRNGACYKCLNCGSTSGCS